MEANLSFLFPDEFIILSSYFRKSYILNMAKPAVKGNEQLIVTTIVVNMFAKLSCKCVTNLNGFCLWYVERTK